MRSQELTRRLVTTWGSEFLSDPLVSRRSHQCWTLPMVLAFIKWRTLDAVRWFSNDELVKRGFPQKKKNFNTSHFVSQRDLRDAEAQLGPPLDKASQPFDELQWAGKGGRITANAMPLRDRERVKIEGFQWLGLRLAEDVMQFFHEADRKEPPYHNIFIDRDQCLAEWLPAGEAPTSRPPSARRRGRQAMDPEINIVAIDLLNSGVCTVAHAAAAKAVLDFGKYPEGEDALKAIHRAFKHASKHCSKKSKPSSNSSNRQR